MTGRILLTMLIMLTLGACSGNRQQGVPTPTPQKQETAPETVDTPQDSADDPFADLNKEEEKDAEEEDDEVDDSDSVDVPSTDISGGGGSGISTIVSMLPLITGLMSGQMPDIGSILGMMGGAAGGGGGLSGITGLLGGKP